MTVDWWDVLKAPLYYREEPDPALAAYRQKMGMPEPQGAIMRVSEGGPTEEVPRSVTPDIAQSPQNPNPFGLTRLNNPRLKGSPLGGGRKRIFGEDFTHFYESPDGQVRAGIRQVKDSNVYLVDHYGVQRKGRQSGRGRRGLNELREVLEQHHGGPVVMRPTNMLDESLGFWDKMMEEGATDNPNVRKEAKSPEALRHKREYETRYESSPERKRYRRNLERERRKRGVAGKGGKDMSHTKRGTIVPEDPHTNRARSHPSVGSTLKSERDGYDTFLPDDHPALTTPVEFDMEGKPVARMSSEKAREQVDIGRECPLCEQGRQVHTHEGAVGCTVPDCYANTSNALTNSYGRAIHRPIPPERLDEVGDPVEHSSTVRDGMRVVGNVNDPNDPRVMPEATRIVYGGDMPDQYHFDMPRPTPIYFHGRNTPSFDQSGYFTTGDPMDLSFRMLKEQTRLFQQGQQTLDGKPAFAPTDFEAMEQRRKEAEAEAQAKEARRQKMMEQARKAGMTTPLHEFAARTPAPEDSQRPE